MRTDLKIMKNNGGFLAILLLGVALLAGLWLRCIGSSYREGLGELKIGTGFDEATPTLQA